jgi:hypothetical protein
MRNLFFSSLVAASLFAGAANAASMFTQGNPYSTASIGLGIVGAAILALTGLCALGALAAGVWVSTHRDGRRRALQR